MKSTNFDVKHPQEHNDYMTLKEQVGKPINDFGACELARLAIRYDGFPGADSVKQMISLLMNQWDVDTELLFSMTREIWAKGGPYMKEKNTQQDWL